MLITVLNAVRCRRAAVAPEFHPSSVDQEPRLGNLPAIGVEYALQRFLHRHRRLPLELGAGIGDVGDAVLHVLVALAVVVFRGRVDQPTCFAVSRIRVGQREIQHHLRQLLTE